MKRIQYHRYGGPEEMRLETYEMPPPRVEEIVVRVKAASINPFDWKVRQGALNSRVRWAPIFQASWKAWARG